MSTLHRAPLPLLALLATAGMATAASAAPVTVPFNLGVGPAGQLLSGPVMQDQTLHFGLRLELAAVIDQATIQANQDRIPQKYRKMASKVDELRYRPSIFIPETLYVSPAFGATGIYGATWRFIGLNAPFGKGPVRLRLGASLIATLALIHSNSLRGLGGEDIEFVFFLRPGIDLTAEVEIKLARNLLISFGWNSAIHLPQVLRRQVGTSFLSIPGDDVAMRASLWHFGQPFLMLHYRFPITRDIPGALPAKNTPPPAQNRQPPRNQDTFVPPPSSTGPVQPTRPPSQPAGPL
ncbi:MAG: hypothetical protein P1V51_04735 [Deltaproteobacteria bacterium]|nr:hypothetical protein [Deltaproteobacteria bacterium]